MNKSSPSSEHTEQKQKADQARKNWQGKNTSLGNEETAWTQAEQELQAPGATLQPEGKPKTLAPQENKPSLEPSTEQRTARPANSDQSQADRKNT
jgi:hypothetical protein